MLRMGFRKVGWLDRVASRARCVCRQTEQHHHIAEQIAAVEDQSREVPRALGVGPRAVRAQVGKQLTAERAKTRKLADELGVAKCPELAASELAISMPWVCMCPLWRKSCQ